MTREELIEEFKKVGMCLTFKMFGYYGGYYYNDRYVGDEREAKDLLIYEKQKRAVKTFIENYDRVDIEEIILKNAELNIKMMNISTEFNLYRDISNYIEEELVKNYKGLKVYIYMNSERIIISYDHCKVKSLEYDKNCTLLETLKYLFYSTIDPIYLLQYTKLNTDDLKGSLLEIFIRYYKFKGYFVSGSIQYDEFKECGLDTEENIRDILQEMINDGIIRCESTIGGSSLYLSGSIREKLINEGSLITKWKLMSENKATFLYEYEKELKSAQENRRCYDD